MVVFFMYICTESVRRLCGKGLLPLKKSMDRAAHTLAQALVRPLIGDREGMAQHDKCSALLRSVDTGRVRRSWLT